MQQQLRRRGAIILGLFALVWAAAGASGLTASPSARTITYIVAAVLTVTAVVAGMRVNAYRKPQARRELPARWLRNVGFINIGQFVAIVAAIAILVAVGQPAWVPPVVAFIVGIHFVPLARQFGQPQYRWTGALLIVLGIGGVVLLVAGPGAGLSRTVVGLGVAVVLWSSALHVAIRG